MASKTETALKTFLKNDYWKEYYETAPSDACREYIKREFVGSLYMDAGEEGDTKALEPTLSADDWRHLLKYAGNNPFRPYCRKKIAELESKEQE